MKKVFACVVVWSLSACHVADHSSVAEGLAKSAKPNDRPVSALTLKHYLEISAAGEILLAREQARLAEPVSDAQKQANLRLVSAFDPTTLRLSLGGDGRYTVTVEYRRDNHAALVSAGANGDAITGEFSATLPQLGLAIDFVCLSQKAAVEICDPQANALVTFHGLGDFLPFEGSRFSFLYQSSDVTGNLQGGFRTDYLGKSPAFASALQGRLLVMDILDPFADEPEQIRLDVTSTHGTLVFAGVDNPGMAHSIRWDLDKARSNDSFKDAFRIIGNVTPTLTNQFAMQLEYPHPITHLFGSAADNQIEFTTSRPLN